MHSPIALPISPEKLKAQLSAERVKRGLRSPLNVPDFWTSMSHSTIATQHGTIPFVPFPWQTAFVNGITDREMVLKSRDVGSSEICVRYFCHCQLRDGGNVLIKADKWDNAKNLVSIARQYLVSLPVGERPRLLKDNEVEIEVEDRGTIKAMAQGGGRSERCRYLLKTERAFWDNPEKEEAAVSGALVAGGLMIVESTSDYSNEYYNRWVAEWDGYRKTFVGRRENPTHDDAWETQKRADMEERGRSFEREFPLTPRDAFMATSNCVFETERIEEYRAACRPPTSTDLNGHLKIWQRPTPLGVYVMGVDVAEGKDAGNDSLDYSGAAVYEWRSGTHVADLHGQWPLDEFAKLVAELGKLYNNALMGVERNNHGHAVLLALRSDALRYPNLYEHRERNELKRGQHEIRKVAGWPTTRVTKPVMEQELAALIKSGGIYSPDDRFWQECLNYVQHGNGRTGAARGGHDDRVIKHMIALQMRKHVQLATMPSLSMGYSWRE